MSAVEGIVIDKTGVVFLKGTEPVWSDFTKVPTSVALSAEIELGKVDGGPKLFGVLLLDVLEPRQRRPLRV